MILILLSALVTCIASLSLGQAALRICGASRWSWMAPPVGIAILMLLALPARYVPGRATTTALIIAILTVASFVWCARDPGHRPPLIGLGVAAPVALLALVPFIAAGRAGTLGVGFDNDMTAHMAWVEAYMSQAVAQVTPLPVAYPLGPHAVVAALSAGLGSRVDMAFAGFTLALPVLTAWTALHALRRPTWLGQLLVATVVSMPYLVAAYYGEGAFKEVLQAQFVLALALWLEHPIPDAGRWRWAPLALLVAGTVSVYSVDGLPWPAAFLGLWLVARAAVRIYHADVHILAAELRAQLSGVAVAVGVLLVVLAPELPQLKNSLTLTIPKSNLGNLVGPLPGWEAFGVWNNPDFRFGTSPGFAGRMWTALVLVLVIYGVVWSIRQGRWMLPAAAGVSSLIWAVSAHSQSPYVTAKALVILSPLLLAVAALPLAERPQRMSAGWWAIAPILALVLWARVAESDLRALRISAVGPTNHLVELRALRRELQGKPTLFLGNDDFIGWELAGVPVTAPVYIGFQLLPIPQQRAWSYGMALDIDSVNAATINANDWVITTRDAAQSALPPQLHLIRTTSDFELWRRAGVVAPRQILDEGQNPGATLNCTPAVRTLIRNGGKAEVRRPPVSFPVGGIPPGGTITVRLSLSPGAWDIATPYQSSRPVTVSGPGGVLRRLPANLDRPGPRWPIGRVVVPPSGSVTLTIHATAAWLTPVSAAANMVAIVATPVGTERIVPLRAACGRYVDWYTIPVRISTQGTKATQVIRQASDVLRSLPADLGNAALQAVGIESDGWVKQDAQLVLAGGPAANLTISGQALALPNHQIQQLHLSINDKAIATKTVPPGNTLDLQIPIPASAGDRHIHLRFTHTTTIAANDPRQATIHLTYLGLASGTITASQPAPTGAPPSISSFPADLGNAALQAVGIESDGWVKQDAQLVLAGGPATNLTISGQALALPNHQTQQLQLTINDKAIATKSVPPGNTLDLQIPIPASAGDRHIHLRFTHTTTIAATDPRQATIHLKLLSVR